MNYKKMVENIDKLVNNDWALGIEMHSVSPQTKHGKPFSQKEAREMAEVIAKIYKISHTLTCKACRMYQK